MNVKPHKTARRVSLTFGLWVFSGCFSFYLGSEPPPPASPTPLPESSPDPGQSPTPSLPPETATDGPTEVPAPSPSPNPTPSPFPIIDQDSDGWPQSLDCNDSRPDVHPLAEDLCGDGVDADCDGADPVCPCIPEEVLTGQVEAFAPPVSSAQTRSMPEDAPPPGTYDSEVPVTIDAILQSQCPEPVVLTSPTSCYVELTIFQEGPVPGSVPLFHEPELCADSPGSWEVAPDKPLVYRFTWDWRDSTGEQVEDGTLYTVRAQWPTGEAAEVQLFLWN